MDVHHALAALKQFIREVESKPTLAHSPESSFLNDFLRTFTAKVNPVRRPASQGFCQLDKFFDALPEDAQFTICGFLNASSLVQVASINRMFNSYLKSEFLPLLAKEFGRFLTVGDRCDVQDRQGKWFGARVVSTRPNELQVHFDDWPSQWNDWIPRSLSSITPFRSHSTARRSSGPIILILGEPGEMQAAQQANAAPREHHTVLGRLQGAHNLALAPNAITAANVAGVAVPRSVPAPAASNPVVQQDNIPAVDAAVQNPVAPVMRRLSSNGMPSLALPAPAETLIPASVSAPDAQSRPRWTSFARSAPIRPATSYVAPVSSSAVLSSVIAAPSTSADLTPSPTLSASSASSSVSSTTSNLSAVSDVFGSSASADSSRNSSPSLSSGSPSPLASGLADPSFSPLLLSAPGSGAHVNSSHTSNGRSSLLTSTSPATRPTFLPATRFIASKK